MALLELTDVHVTMGVQEILRGISIAVPERAIVAVLGGNGVGKTTLMRAISGIYGITAGSIRFDGQEIGNTPSHGIVRHGLAQAPEGRQIFGTMTVRENLILGGITVPQGEISGLLEKSLELFPVLKERLNQKAGSLSGGEQQMLCIGRALMAKPKLLLLDEPSLGLAPKVVKQIFDLVKRIRDEGATILIVEQNAKAALKVADTAYVVEGGKVAVEGKAADLAKDQRVIDAYLGGAAHAKG
jgi:branched-chain amino acid transport system ATP-binding protein